MGKAFLAFLNRLLGDAGWARQRLSVFAGHQARLILPPLTIDFSIGEEGFLEETGAQSPEVTLSLPADTPLRLLSGIERVMAGASVSGNAEFATTLSEVFRHLHWDVEETLAHWIGDIPAHRLATTFNSFAGESRAMLARLLEQCVEHASREAGWLVSSEEFATFRNEVHALEAQLNRLSHRIDRFTHTTRRSPR